VQIRATDGQLNCEAIWFILVSKKHNLKIKYSDYFKEKKKIFFSFEKKIKPNPGVLNLLKDLKKNKVKLALSSSNERENILFFLDKHNLNKYFDLILTSEDVKKHKPNPEAFLKPTKLLKVNPKDCVGIEDSLQGIVSINKANLKSIALLSEFTTKSDFKKLNASLIIKSLNKLSYKKLNELFKKE
jgi:beta-phosphoglucomutase